MQHPKIDAISLETTQGILQILHRPLFPTFGQRFAVRATFRHDKRLVSDPLQGLPHPLLRSSAMITPSIVEKCHAPLDRLVGNSGRLRHILSQPQGVTPKAQHANSLVVPTEFPCWHGVRCAGPALG